MRSHKCLGIAALHINDSLGTAIAGTLIRLKVQHTNPFRREYPHLSPFQNHLGVRPPRYAADRERRSQHLHGYVLGVNNEWAEAVPGHIEISLSPESQLTAVLKSTHIVTDFRPGLEKDLGIVRQKISLDRGPVICQAKLQRVGRLRPNAAAAVGVQEHHGSHGGCRRHRRQRPTYPPTLRPAPFLVPSKVPIPVPSPTLFPFPIFALSPVPFSVLSPVPFSVLSPVSIQTILNHFPTGIDSGIQPLHHRILPTLKLFICQSIVIGNIGHKISHIAWIIRRGLHPFKDRSLFTLICLSGYILTYQFNIRPSHLFDLSFHTPYIQIHTLQHPKQGTIYFIFPNKTSYKTPTPYSLLPIPYSLLISPYTLCIDSQL